MAQIDTPSRVAQAPGTYINRLTRFTSTRPLTTYMIRNENENQLQGHPNYPSYVITPVNIDLSKQGKSNSEKKKRNHTFWTLSYVHRASAWGSKQVSCWLGYEGSWIIVRRPFDPLPGTNSSRAISSLELLSSALQAPGRTLYGIL